MVENYFRPNWKTLQYCIFQPTKLLIISFSQNVQQQYYAFQPGICSFEIELCRFVQIEGYKWKQNLTSKVIQKKVRIY